MRRGLIGSLRAAAPFAVAIALGLGPLGLNDAQAHDEKDPRHMAMESLSKNMEALSRSLRQGPPGDAEHARAAELIDVANRMPALFETPNPGENNNRAKPEIWSDWAGFSAKIDEFRDATGALAAALKADDPAAWSGALQTVGRSCASCHRPYRTPRR